MPLNRWHSSCHIKRKSHKYHLYFLNLPGLGPPLFGFAHRLRRMDAAIKLSPAPVLRILRLICAGDSPDSLTVTKKGLIDLVERLQPRGPSGVQHGMGQGGARATYARKLARALHKSPELKLGTLQGDLHNEVYQVQVVEHVLTAFGFSLPETQWQDIVVKLGSFAIDGQLKKKDVISGEPIQEESIVQPLADSDSRERPRPAAPSAPSALGSESVAESNIIEPTIDTRSERSSRPRAPMLMANTVKRRKLEESSTFIDYQQIYGGHSWVDLIHELIYRDKSLEEAEKNTNKTKRLSDC